jgi:FMN phosphatase YigB (HAD superfamily)
MIQAVVFDLGKVLVDFDYGIAAPRIAARSNMTVEELYRFMMKTPLLLQYETGLVTTDDFYSQICRGTGFRDTLDEFAVVFGNIFSPIEPMIQLHASLNARGIPTFVFSNTNELAIRHVRKAYPFFKNFNGYIFSYEHQAMKPDAKLYQVVERESGRRGAEILYLDDRPENVAAGAERGWHAVLHESPEKSREAVMKFGLLGEPEIAR